MSASSGSKRGICSRGSLACSLVVLVTVAAACDRKPAVRASIYGDRDSASVRITADSVPLWGEADRWQIDPVPTLDVGVLDGNPMYEFALARRPVRLSDGRIAVVNMKTTEIRFFSPQGVFLRSIGRLGRGPGEFEQIWDMKKIAGDSLMALEPVSETTIFDSHGEYVRKFRLERGPPGYSNIWWLGRLDGGYLVAVALARFGTRALSQEELKGSGETEAVSAPQRPVGYRDTLMHFLYTMDGRLVDSIAELPGQFLGAGEFPPEAAYAFDGPRFYHSPGDRIEIREFTLAIGPDRLNESRPMRLSRIIRLPSPPSRAVTEEHKNFVLEPARQRLRKSGRLSEADIEASLRSRHFFDSLPAHARAMRIDPDHNIWLRHFTPDPDAPALWEVIDAQGKWLGRVETPGRFEVNEIGMDYILGLWRDAFDMQHLRMYRIRKPK